MDTKNVIDDPLLSSAGAPAAATSPAYSSGDGLPVPTGSGFLSQLGSTMRRQAVQKSRMKCALCLEIAFPVLFIIGLVMAARAADIVTEPGAEFVNPNQPPYDIRTHLHEAVCRNAPMSDPNLNTMLTPCNSSQSGPKYDCSTPADRIDGVPIDHLCVRSDFIYEAIGRLSGFSQPIRLLGFDDFVLMQWATRLVHKRHADGLFAGRSVKNALMNSGQLYFVPWNNPAVQTMFAALNQSSKLLRYVTNDGRRFDKREDAENWLTSVDAEGKGWSLVYFEQLDTNGINFDISMNRTASAVPTFLIRDRFTRGLGDRMYSIYYASGFLSIQSLINGYYTNDYKSVVQPMDDLAAVPMPYSEYKNNIFLSIAGSLSPLVLVLSFLFTVSQLTKRLVEEKEQRLREAMMIMGLGKAAFFLSWMCVYLLQNLFSCIIITIVLKGGLLTQSDPTIIFLVYFVFGCSTITLSMLLSSLFSKSRVSALVAPVVYLMVSIPSFAIPQDSPAGTLLLLSFLSPSAFAIGTGLLFQYEQGQGMGWDSVASGVDKVNMATCLTFLTFDTVMYLLLSLYLDAVLPSEWGTRAHPLFCIKNLFKKKGAGTGKGKFSEQVNRVDLGDEVNSPKFAMKAGVGHHDAVEHYPGTDAECSVHLNYLYKEFPADDAPKVAVDNFEMKLFPNQVTVLLGHNGAGKTTTMNMLTGMLEMTDGDCIVYGKSVRESLQATRAEIGFCPQHNILWPNLTCLEHLRYFARLKGVPADKIEEQSLRMIEKVDLLPQKDQFSVGLSGGQKRKLSVAIAFIGGSRLVLLDEPTAGMDVAARRHTWDLLREMSHGRTVVLTTHFMDEADLLGNRIAIMSKGALHSYGSPMFLKNRLGTGYAMKVSTSKPMPDATPLLQKIQRTITAATVKENKGQEIAFSMPIDAANRFPEVLRNMEGSEWRNEFGITGVSMSVSTLEDVFLRIAHEEEVGAADTDAAAETDAVIKALDNVFTSARSEGTSNFRQLRGLLAKRFHNARRDRCTLMLQVVLPLIAICFAMLLANLGPPPFPQVTLDYDMYGEKQMISSANCTSMMPFFNARYDKDDQGIIPALNLSKNLMATTKSHGFAERYVGLQCHDPEMNLREGGMPPVPTSLLFTNASGLHSLPQLLNEYYEAFARLATTQNALSMKVGTKPLPWGARQEASINSFQSLIVGFFTLIPFTFIPAAFVSWIVKERECKAKHLQFVSGVNYGMFWLANYLFDLASFFITEMIAIMIFGIFGREEFIGSAEAGSAIFLLFTLYGLSSIANSYAISFVFKSHSSAQNVVMMANLICGFALVITIWILKRIESTESAADVLAFLFRFVPSYCLGEGILALSSAQLNKQLGDDGSVYDMDKAGWAMLYMAINFVGFTILTLVFDHPSRQRARQALFFDPNKIPDAIPDEDPDVLAERKAIEDNDPSRANDVVKVKHLRKVYQEGDKVAVKNLSFGVKKGEVFGFLGTNGAGKTTTMSVLTGEFMPTCGSLTVAGHDVVSDAEAARQNIGYCPQFDALIDLMNAEEHLYLYAALRGIPQAKTAPLVDALIEACNLGPHRKTPSMKMSGGNKRKLSVAVSLIGGPPIVILDEPSAGMDPLARRHLWDVIIYVAKRSSVIITTHHLEEVDVLAHRVGMMVDGGLRCMGSLEHLKKKFGGGFEMNVKVATEERVDFVKQFVMNQFPAASLIEERNQKLTYGLPDHATKLSNVFEIMSRVSSDPSLQITDYTVQQSSLEQVFIRISENQAAIEEEQELAKENGPTSSQTNRPDPLAMPAFGADVQMNPVSPGIQGANDSIDEIINRAKNPATASL